MHWRVYGANGIVDNPTCSTLATFRTPATWDCWLHRTFKTLFRARPGLIPFGGGHLAHQQFEVSAATFSANGTNISGCVLHSDSHKMMPPCSIGGFQPPGHELLVLRHYFTRSRTEWTRKMQTYQSHVLPHAELRASLGTKSYRYTPDWANQTFSELNARFNPRLIHDARRRNANRCGARLDALT